MCTTGKHGSANLCFEDLLLNYVYACFCAAVNFILDMHMTKLPHPMRLLNKPERLRHMAHTWESQKGKTLEQLVGWG